jgi:integrase
LKVGRAFSKGRVAKNRLGLWSARVSAATRGIRPDAFPDIASLIRATLATLATTSRYVPGITSHGLRHSFGSTAEDLGFSLPTIKALLRHAGSSVTEGYIHKVDSALVLAATRIAEHIEETMNGKKSQKVVSLRTP